MSKKTVLLVLFAMLCSCAAEDLKDPKSSAEIKTQPSSTEAPVAAVAAERETYTDPVGGFSITIPAGYRKLTDDETRDVFKGLSDYLGKEVGERARKRPPVYFIGPVDPKKPSDHPPSFAIAFSNNENQIDPAQIPVLKEQLEEAHKREGDKVGAVALSVIKVDGIVSLQEENDVINPVNNERNKLIRVAVPGKGRWFELVFNYSNDQNDAVHGALKEALDSFKVMEHPPENIENTRKWMRVLYYTVGFGLAGVVLSLILRFLTRDGAKNNAHDPKSVQ